MVPFENFKTQLPESESTFLLSAGLITGPALLQQLGFPCVFISPQPQLPKWNRCPKNLFRKQKLAKLQLLPHEFRDAEFPSSSQRLQHLFSRHLYDILPQCAEISRVITLNLAEVLNKLHSKTHQKIKTKTKQTKTPNKNKTAQSCS